MLAECDHPSVEEVAHISLHSLKPNSSARLAFEMVEKRGERGELFCTPSSRTMVDLLPIFELLTPDHAWDSCLIRTCVQDYSRAE